MNSIRLLLLASLMLIASQSNSSLAQKAVASFNKESGELYWDIDSTFRLNLEHKCRLNNWYNEKVNNTIHDLISAVDLFSVLEHKEDFYRGVVCKERGLTVANKLTRDGAFPEFGDTSPDIYINGKYLYKRSGAKENYEHIYAAIQQNMPVTVTVGKISRFPSILGSNKRENIEKVISIDNLDDAEEVHNQKTHELANQLNNMLQEKYWRVIFADFMALIVLIVTSVFFKLKILPIAKNVLSILLNRTAALVQKTSLLFKFYRSQKLKNAATDEVVRETVRQTINGIPESSNKGDETKNLKLQIKDAIAKGDNAKADILIEILKAKQ